MLQIKWRTNSSTITHLAEIAPKKTAKTIVECFKLDKEEREKKYFMMERAWDLECDRLNILIPTLPSASSMASSFESWLYP